MKYCVNCMTAVVPAIAGLGTPPVATGQVSSRPEGWRIRADAQQGGGP